MPKPLNGSHYTRADDELMMTTPNEWPRWPWLPLKGGSIKPGALYAGDLVEPDGTVIVHHVNTFNLPFDLDDAECTTYESPAAACDAGWKVD